MIQSRNDKANLNEFEAILFLNFRMHCLLCSMFWHEHCHFFISFFPPWRIFDGKKMVSQNSPTSSCWALIVTGKEANFFPFHCKFLHELNQLSNKKTLPWGRREKKELILLWSWEVEDEQENKVQRKTTFEIWLLFQRICGLDKKKEADLFEEKNLRSTFRNCCWACDVCLKVKGYICWVVVDGTVVTLADVFFGDHHHHSSPTFFEISKKNCGGELIITAVVFLDIHLWHFFFLQNFFPMIFLWGHYGSTLRRKS